MSDTLHDVTSTAHHPERMKRELWLWLWLVLMVATAILLFTAWPAPPVPPAPRVLEAEWCSTVMAPECTKHLPAELRTLTSARDYANHAAHTKLPAYSYLGPPFPPPNAALLDAAPLSHLRKQAAESRTRPAPSLLPNANDFEAYPAAIRETLSAARVYGDQYEKRAAWWNAVIDQEIALRQTALEPYWVDANRISTLEHQVWTAEKAGALQNQRVWLGTWWAVVGGLGGLGLGYWLWRARARPVRVSRHVFSLGERTLSLHDIERADKNGLLLKDGTRVDFTHCDIPHLKQVLDAIRIGMNRSGVERPEERELLETLRGPHPDATRET